MENVSPLQNIDIKHAISGLNNIKVQTANGTQFISEQEFDLALFPMTLAHHRRHRLGFGLQRAHMTDDARPRGTIDRRVMHLHEHDELVARLIVADPVCPASDVPL